MVKTKLVAVTRICFQNRERVAVMSPGRTGIVLHTLFYEHEMRRLSEFRTNMELASRKDVSKMARLAESLTIEFSPAAAIDETKIRMEQLVASKTDARPVIDLAKKELVGRA